LIKYWFVGRTEVIILVKELVFLGMYLSSVYKKMDDKKFFRIFFPILVIIILITAFYIIGRQTNKIETTIPKTTTAGTTNPNSTIQSVIESDEYSIGCIGPAGGFIFYINPNYKTDGWRYFEAALEDQSNGIEWDDGDWVSTWTKTEIGTGKENTQTIVEVLGEGSYAAQLCNDLIIEGYNDWFLPSKDELNLMFENLRVADLGDFTGDWYWSSSECVEWNAYFQNFGLGYANLVCAKSSTLRVRAIRAF
jgi:hypothetical protein